MFEGRYLESERDGIVCLKIGIWKQRDQERV